MPEMLVGKINHTACLSTLTNALHYYGLVRGRIHPCLKYRFYLPYIHGLARFNTEFLYKVTHFMGDFYNQVTPFIPDFACKGTKNY